MVEMETLKAIVKSVKKSVSGIRSGHIDGGPEIGFSIYDDSEDDVMEIKNNVEIHIRAYYDVSVISAATSTVSYVDEEVGPDFAFKIEENTSD